MHTLVVGAGAAGAVVAARLTESSDHEVILVEAGPDYATEAALPADLRDGRRNSLRDHDWGYELKPTAAQKTPFMYPRGRVVGGSSAVNTCIFIRGQRYDYDEWADLGLDEWTFDACLPAFLRVENDLDFEGPNHARSGPIPVRRHPPEELARWQAAFVESAKALGFPETRDHNDPTAPGGVGPHTMNRVGGVRMSASRCYLTPEVRARPGLRLLPDRHACRVRFENGAFAGLEVSHRGAIEIVRADRLVLAAGAVGTTGLLLRSGVGPRDELARLGVTPVVHSPTVGARLLDHPGVAMIFAPRWGVSNIEDPLLQTLLRWTAPSSTKPFDLQTQPGSNFPLAGIVYPLVSLMTTIGKPRGHAEMRFPTADPFAKPIFTGRFLENADDHRMARDSIDLMWQLARQRPLAELAFPLFPKRSVLASSERIDAWLPLATGSGYHPCGTVPMSARGIEAGAVDGRGNLRGVRGVTVADASIMPTIPSANTHLPTLMIAERIAAWLREG